MLIKYHDINSEIRKCGLTRTQVADILGITYQALHMRIKKDKPDIHLIIYALSSYFQEVSLNLEQNKEYFKDKQ